VLFAAAFVGVYAAVNYVRGRRRLAAAQAFRESQPSDRPGWTGSLGGISDMELFDTENDSLEYSGDRPANIACTNEGVQITLHESYASGRAVPPLTIPWNKIHNAGLKAKQPKWTTTLGAPARTEIAVAVSERWMQDIEDEHYPVKEEPTPEQLAEIKQIDEKYPDSEYEATMREEYGDLYGPGLWMIDFLSYDVTGLVDAIKMRATGVPEKADDNW
jgi:hypothetical protein